MKLTFYSTPGHGYLRVPKTTFIKVGGDPLKISGYSGHDINTLYLEEDSDAGYFLKLLESNGIKPSINSKYVNSVSNTHNYIPELFGCKLRTGEQVLLTNDQVGVIENSAGKILVNVSGARYRLPKTNPFKYVKSMV
jgi:hypothetical protein